MFCLSVYDQLCPLPIFFTGAEVCKLLRSDTFIVLLFCFVLYVRVCFDNPTCRPCVEGKSGFWAPGDLDAAPSLGLASRSPSHSCVLPMVMATSFALLPHSFNLRSNLSL